MIPIQEPEADSETGFRIYGIKKEIKLILENLY